MSKISGLPNELIYDIILKGNMSEIESFCLANKRFNALCEDRYGKEIKKTLEGKTNMQIYDKLNKIIVIYTTNEINETNEYNNFKKASEKFEKYIKIWDKANKDEYDITYESSKNSFGIRIHPFSDDDNNDINIYVIGAGSKNKILKEIVDSNTSRV